MEQAFKKLYAESYKKFTFPYIIKHAKQKNKNLVEMMTRLPNKGIGCTVWRENWPKGMAFKIEEIKIQVLELFNNRCHAGQV